MKIGSIAEKAAAEKRDIRENLALNFDGDAESMKTLIEFEVMNHARGLEFDGAILPGAGADSCISFTSGKLT